jgi:hypothetical protein
MNKKLISLVMLVYFSAFISGMAFSQSNTNQMQFSGKVALLIVEENGEDSLRYIQSCTITLSQNRLIIIDEPIERLRAIMGISTYTFSINNIQTSNGITTAELSGNVRTGLGNTFEGYIGTYHSAVLQGKLIETIEVSIKNEQGVVISWNKWQWSR